MLYYITDFGKKNNPYGLTCRKINQPINQSTKHGFYFRSSDHPDKPHSFIDAGSLFKQTPNTLL